jgi:hypothetical protein
MAAPRCNTYRTVPSPGRTGDCRPETGRLHENVSVRSNRLPRSRWSQRSKVVPIGVVQRNIAPRRPHIGQSLTTPFLVRVPGGMRV